MKKNLISSILKSTLCLNRRCILIVTEYLPLNKSMYFSNPQSVSFFSPTRPLLIEIKFTGTLPCSNEARFEVIRKCICADS